MTSQKFKNVKLENSIIPTSFVIKHGSISVENIINFKHA